MSSVDQELKRVADMARNGLIQPPPQPQMIVPPQAIFGGVAQLVREKVLTPEQAYGYLFGGVNLTEYRGPKDPVSPFPPAPEVAPEVAPETAETPIEAVD